MNRTTRESNHAGLCSASLLLNSCKLNMVMMILLAKYFAGKTEQLPSLSPILIVKENSHVCPYC